MFRSHAGFAEHSQVCGKLASSTSGAQPSRLNPAPAETSGNGVITAEVDLPGPSQKPAKTGRKKPAGHMIVTKKIKLAPAEIPPKPAVSPESIKPCTGIGPKPNVVIQMAESIRMKPGPKSKVGLKPGPKPKVGLKPNVFSSEMKPVAGSLKLKLKLSPVVQSFIKDSNFDKPLPSMKKKKAGKQPPPDRTAEKMTSSAVGTGFQSSQLVEGRKDYASRPAKKLKVSHDKPLVEDNKTPSEPLQTRPGQSLCPHCSLGESEPKIFFFKPKT